MSDLSPMFLVRTRNGNQFGPLSAGELKEMAAHGTIGREDEVQRVGGTRWHSADSVKGLFPAAASVTSSGPMLRPPAPKQSLRQDALRVREEPVPQTPPPPPPLPVSPRSTVTLPRMPYVEQTLLPGEHVVHCGEIHWAIFLPGIILLPLFGIGLILLLWALVRKLTSELAVTDQRVIIKVGLISRKTIEMNLAKIENIQVDQPILGRILGYGTITVVGTGGTHEPFSCIVDPLAFRNAVHAHSRN